MDYCKKGKESTLKPSPGLARALMTGIGQCAYEIAEAGRRRMAKVRSEMTPAAKAAAPAEEHHDAAVPKEWGDTVQPTIQSPVPLRHAGRGGSY